MKKLNQETRRKIRERNQTLYAYIYEEPDVRKLFQLLFAKNVGDADSVTSTFSLITEILND